MSVTKQQILTGTVKYVKKEIVPKIEDKPLKMIIAAGVSILEINPAVADPWLTSPMISTMLREDGGVYDLDQAFEVIKKTMTDYGDFPVVIPAIKLLSPEEKQLIFTIDDVKKLKAYIDGGDD